MTETTVGQEHALAVQIGEHMNRLVQSGFKLPLRIVVVGVNGSVLIYTGTRGNFELVAEYPDNSDFIFPLNVLVVDAEGNAARILLDNPDQTESEFIN